MTDTPYNPLDKINLAKSIQIEMLRRDPLPLSDVSGIKGAGIYVIYYSGSFSAYEPIASGNRDGAFARPIYIGKAIPKGGRKGGLSTDASRGRALAERLGQHAESVRQANDLDLADFHVRYLVIDDIWIPLGENVLIDTFGPLWNRAIDGFGNKDPGKRRANQFKSPWDVLHPGRVAMQKLADSELTADFLLQRVDDFFAGRPLKRLPKKIAQQIEEEAEDAEDAADEA